MFENPPKKILRKMGYLSDQKGILDRYFRESDNWQQHLDNCKEFIYRDVKERKPEKVIVLGSGWLLDLPLEEILEITASVTLVDIIHPPHIKAKAKKHSNIHLITGDISGGLIFSVFNLIKDSLPGDLELGLKNLNFQITEALPSDSFVISLNILNQLDILLVDYLFKCYNFKAKNIIEFRRKIQASHLEMIGNNKGIIITDYKERQRNLKTRIEAERNLLHVDLPKGLNMKNWTWEFDRSGSYIEDAEVELDVIAISF